MASNAQEKQHFKKQQDRQTRQPSCIPQRSRQSTRYNLRSLQQQRQPQPVQSTALPQKSLATIPRVQEQQEQEEAENQQQREQQLLRREQQQLLRQRQQHEEHQRQLFLQFQNERIVHRQQQQQLRFQLGQIDHRNALRLFSMRFDKRPTNTKCCLLRFTGLLVTIFQLLLFLSFSNEAVLAEGNVGCHFVRTLCLQGSEVCFDDNIFGKCIPTTGVDVEDIEKTPLTEEQSRTLASMLEELQGAGLGWDHPYVQCRVQGTLFSLQKQTPLPPNLCANLGPLPNALDAASAMAYVRFATPQEQYDASFYYPPLKKQLSNGINTIFRQLQLQDRQLRHDPMELEHFEKLDLSQDSAQPTQAESVMDLFMQSERNRLQREQEEREAELNAERKHALRNRVELYQMLAASEPDPQPYQRNPPTPAVLSPVTISALDKLERIVEKDAPYSHADLEDNEQFFPEHYMQFKRNEPAEPAHRSYFRELAAEQGLEQEPAYQEYYSNAQVSEPLAVQEDWLTPAHKRQSHNIISSAELSQEIDNDNDLNESNLLQRFRENSLMRNSLTPFQQEAILASNSYAVQQRQQKPERVFTEAGLVYMQNGDTAQHVLSEALKKEEARELLENMLGFKRRERLDVKKPGPLIGPPDANAVEHDNKTGSPKSDNKGTKAQTKEVLPAHIKASSQTHRKKNVKNHSDEDHAPHTVDTEYAHVYVKNPIDSWNDGVRIMNELANILHMQGYFTYLTVQQHLVSFRVDSSNPERKTAADIARTINESRGVKNNILRRLGVTVVHAGIGDKVRADGEDGVTSARVQLAEQSQNVTHIMAYMFAGAGAAAVIVIFIILILIKRHDKKRDKLGGLQTSIAGAESCSKDYQELCRARMAGKSNAAEPATCGRITSLSKENDRPPSSRSSTSSWSEEPAFTNMDISTGHMVLSYMEDHLRNKGRLQREWEALCRYEAEPSARDAAQQPQCINLNRTNAPLPYDHSRVVLNHLANAEGLDYINASTITDHDPRAPAYVAAQGPLPTTLAHFWQMIWEQGAVVIVALCRLQESGEIACARYWPEEGAEVYHIYEVHLVSEHIWCDDYLVRSFYLKNLRTSETRTVTQFHFLSWPHGGVPAQAKALLDFRRKVNKSYRGRSCPIVVHGSTGAGRTGAYILLDLVLGRMNKGAREIDIAATLEHLRDQRAGLVETRQQFEFVLMAVAEEVHAILKALPANQSNEKRDLEAKDSASVTSTATTSTVLKEEEDSEMPSTSKSVKEHDPATNKDKDKMNTTKDKDNKPTSSAKSKKK